MFSYRHAFHAGNHADVLKHTVLVAVLRHLLQKNAALTVVDTHAGAGLYRLHGEWAKTSGEAADGVLCLVGLGKQEGTASASLAPALQDYLNVVRTFNQGDRLRVYPGSPFITQQLLRTHDRLKLFELLPADARSLAGYMNRLDAGRQVAVLRENGFTGTRRFLPPPARRALVLCDPSYEIKSDYGRVQEMLADGLRRFATGVYAIWHPIIARSEAHDLPRRLKSLADTAGKPWLHATLSVKSSGGKGQHAGLPGSGMFVVNPPYILAAALQASLPQMVQLLGQDRHARYVLETG